ncbi:hypothetical protein [Subtercola sp. RTI3]|nr:hypothetical protein [Subtercola sp. RTI3]MEA9983690.1 hypothetical protein [Subtercola sp. RTI3]
MSIEPLYWDTHRVIAERAQAALAAAAVAQAVTPSKLARLRAWLSGAQA